MARRPTAKIAEIAEKEKKVSVMITFSGNDYELIKYLQKSYEEKIRFPITFAQCARAACAEGIKSLVEEHKKYRPGAQ